MLEFHQPRTAASHTDQYAPLCACAPGGGGKEEEEVEEVGWSGGEKNPQFQLLPERLLWAPSLCVEVGAESKQ